MRSGLLPSQQRELRRAFKKADAFDHFRERTRRSFLGLGLLGALGTAAGFWFGTVRSADKGRPSANAGPVPLEKAHELALGPDAELRRNAAMFLVMLDRSGGDEVTWAGFGRLARMATADGGDRRLASRLLATTARLAPPVLLQPLVRRLQEVGR